jgi:hypothetical protein
MDNLKVHFTKTEKIEREDGAGWEFTCDECSYRARYIHFPEHGKQTLEIIDIGDPTARHTNSANQENLAESLPNQASVPTIIEDEASWLTPELREQIDLILAKFEWK